MSKLFAPMLTVAAILGIGGYWLSHGDPAAAASCEHGLQVNACPFCTPSLIEAGGPCPEHGVPEALCWKCSPRLIAAFKKKNDWCAEHETPESLCARCGSGHAAAVADDGHDHAGGDHHGHDHSRDAEISAMPRSQRPASEDCTKSEIKVHLASDDIAARAGLSIRQVERRAMADTIVCNAELAYDGNRFAKLTARAAGVVREVRVDLGRKVQKGETLAIIDAPEVASTKADLLQARASAALHKQHLERVSGLKASGGVAQREILNIENSLAQSRIDEARAFQKLKSFGLSEPEIAQLDASNDMSSVLAITAPFDGEIIDRSAVVGEAADAGRALFSVADTSRMWAMLDVADPHAALKPGMAVQLRIEGMDAKSNEGRLTWVSTRVDERTRTLKARAEFENPDGNLRANLFGSATVQVGDSADRVLVPRGAVQWDGCCNVVFVPTSPRDFEPRKVLLGRGFDDLVEVRDGLSGGDSVVVQGSFLLKTEIMKGEIGAGCCGDHAKKD